MKRSEDLGRPRNQPKIGVHYNRSAFGEFAEDVARVMGTARFLVIQSVLVIIWVAINVLFISFRWDKYPFILLNLMFSVQAAYAAPLILLAHNRTTKLRYSELCTIALFASLNFFDSCKISLMVKGRSDVSSIETIARRFDE
ncbi:MAG: DUF1003 domain-containing protein [Actinobacteria bacterium]|nr:DUF1003 domain-containing protein [Actinomycetota bacterium]